jgi:hypothetical protein
MQKVVITTFVMPHELDDLERLLIALSTASKYTDGAKYEFYVALSVSDQLFDWNNSTLSADFFRDRFYSLKTLTDWASRSIFIEKEAILGVVSARLHAHRDCTHATHFLWLDPDICFDHKALYQLDRAIGGVTVAGGTDTYLITPDIVRYWDGSWDVLVNDRFEHQPINYCRTNNPFVDCGEKGELELRIVRNDIKGQPMFKFGGGWFNCLSKPLLDRIPLQESMGHYGLDDAYIMWGMHILKERGEKMAQFNLHNYVVCENFRYRNRTYLDSVLKRIDRKEEFYKIADKAVWEALKLL